MQELFNPAGLSMVEDRQGAIAYGWIAPRVCYARFVGSLSAELGSSFVHALEGLVREVPALAYFADASALREYDLLARTRLRRFVQAERSKFATLVVLTWSEGVSSATRAFAAALGEPVELIADPLDFERALSNVAPRAWSDPRNIGQVWQALAPR
jgi:hypothetical protein